MNVSLKYRFLHIFRLVLVRILIFLVFLLFFPFFCAILALVFALLIFLL
jgi:hypothetical protein